MCSHSTRNTEISWKCWAWVYLQVIFTLEISILSPKATDYPAYTRTWVGTNNENYVGDIWNLTLCALIQCWYRKKFSWTKRSEVYSYIGPTQYCSKTALTGETRFHCESVSIPGTRTADPPQTGSKWLTHWTRETVHCSEIAGPPQVSPPVTWPGL